MWSFSLNFLSIFLALGSCSFLAFWVSLEMSSFAFVLLFRSFNSKDSVYLLKYFLIQGVSSSFLIWAYFLGTGELMFMALILKMGLAPFHFWVIPIMQNLDWDCWVVFMVIQKIIPIMFLTNLKIDSVGLQVISLINVVTSCVMSFHLSCLRTLMFYSSMFNMGWIMVSLSYCYLVLSLVIIYCLMMLSVWAYLSVNKYYYLQQLYLKGSGSVTGLMSFFHLMGLPPGLGFMMKWLVVTSLSFSPLVLCTLLVSSLWMVYIYLNIILHTLFKSKLSSLTSKSVLAGSLLALGLSFFISLLGLVVVI